MLKISISLPNEQVITVDLAETVLYGELKMLVGLESNLDMKDYVFMKDGTYIQPDETKSLKDLNIKNLDLLIVTQNPVSSYTKASQLRDSLRDVAKNNPVSAIDFSSIKLPGMKGKAGSTSSGNTYTSAETTRQLLLMKSPYQISLLKERNPELAAVLNDPVEFERVYKNQQSKAMSSQAELTQLMSADQLDPKIQERIAELIQQSNIDNQMETALEHYPETFGQVTMLFVDCKLQGQNIKAFVDSGAQTSIMSQACAKRCNLDRLVDKRWAGKAYGVGTQNIIGRVHNSLLEVAGVFIPTSFIVLQDQQLDLLIGLDMLKRHQCCIDLKRNLLIIEEKVEVPFLPESELPMTAKNPDMMDTSNHVGGSGNQDDLKPATSNSYAAPLTNDNLTDEQEIMLAQLESNGVSRPEAIKELRESDWDLDKAYASILSKK